MYEVEDETDATLSPHSFTACYEDNVQDRLFPEEIKLFFDDNSNQVCGDFCSELNYEFSGLEYRYECFCGNALDINRQAFDTDECNMLCWGLVHGRNESVCGRTDECCCQNGAMPCNVKETIIVVTSIGVSPVAE